MTDVTIVRQASKTIDLFKDETPQYPEGLKLYPEDYNIVLNKEDWHPASEAKPLKVEKDPPIKRPEEDEKESKDE